MTMLGHAWFEVEPASVFMPAFVGVREALHMRMLMALLGHTNVILIQTEDTEMSEQVYDEMHNTAVTSDVGDPVTFNGVLSMKRGRLWKFSMIAEVNNFLYRDVWIPRKLKREVKSGSH